LHSQGCGWVICLKQVINHSLAQDRIDFWHVNVMLCAEMIDHGFRYIASSLATSCE
jgi:hypothetical protein